MAKPLKPAQMRTYFAFTEAASLLQYAVQQQLQTEGNLSYVQFEILAKLVDAQRPLTMTDLADGVVYSRSGLTYQVGLLEKAGYVTRAASSDDERVVTVTLTDAGREVLATVFPGHIEVVSDLLFRSMSTKDVAALAGLLRPVRDHMRSAPPRSAAPRRRAHGA